MLILLSSAARKLYREDVLRALFLPVRAELKFRYRQKYLSSKVHDDLLAKTADRTDNGYQPEKALIAFADNDCSNGHLPLVPVRFADVFYTYSNYGTVWLYLRLGGFVKNAGKVLEGKELPGRPVRNGRDISGDWVFRLPEDVVSGLEESFSLEDAYDTLKELRKHSAFDLDAWVTAGWWITSIDQHNYPVRDHHLMAEIRNFRWVFTQGNVYSLHMLHRGLDFRHTYKVECFGGLENLDSPVKEAGSPCEMLQWYIGVSDKEERSVGSIVVTSEYGNDYELKSSMTFSLQSAIHY